MDHPERLAEWQKRIDMLNKHIALGQRLSDKAQEILDSLNTYEDLDAKDLATLIKAASDAVVKGAKLEADSRDKRGKLMNSKPYEF